jgi:hypothetical protein
VLTRHSLVTPRRMTTVYTREDVAKHASSASNWVTIDDKVYDLTRFASFHPGGKAFIDRVAGQDATEKFYAFHRQDILKGLAAKYLIGVVSDPPSKRHANVVLAPGELSQVPYAEPSAFQGLPSPFYDESHFRFRAALRRFFDEEVMPDAVSLDARGVHPSKDLWRKLGSRGILASRVQSGPWLQDVVDNCGVVLPGGIKPAEFDAFHELIAHEESSGRLYARLRRRLGCRVRHRASACASVRHKRGFKKSRPGGSYRREKNLPRDKRTGSGQRCGER